MMMMISSLKLVLIFGAALGLYKFTAQNTNHLASIVPLYNTNNTDQLATPTSALQLNPGFDYFVFVLQWPAAFCNIQRSRQKQCNPDPVLAKHQNKFTVHGLWPQLDGAQSPLYCPDQTMRDRDLKLFQSDLLEYWPQLNGAKSPLSCTTRQSMKDSDLKLFQKDLLEYWPDLFSAKNFSASRRFWRHEWDKHGTCSSKIFTPRQYLNITLDLAKKYAKPIFDGLQKIGIEPNGTTLHRLKDMRKNVKNLTGGYDPILSIVLNGSGDQLLLEIKLCVEQDGVKRKNCDEFFKFAAP